MKAIDKFLKILIEKDGSDLHLCSTLAPKIRVHGILEPISNQALSVDEVTEIMKECAPPEKWRIFVENNDF